MGVKLAAASGGSVELVPTNTASNYTATMPANTGTVVTTGSTAVVSQAMMGTNVGATGPAFYAYLNQTQSFTGGVYTKVQLNAELFDTASAFDTSTYKFTPQVAGYYQVNAQAASITSTYSGDNIVAIYKNGTAYTYAYVATYGIPNVSNLVYMNGSTDYLELYMRLGTSQNLAASTVSTYLSGALVRAA